ncbi:ABC transporter permease [Enterococcus sp. DIV0876]|uniref:ABC transporter permease n=1 Tax=Enterococcus sp. DIV0876 TaxID=2774633 RepID=UPI003D2FA50E
MADFFSQRLQRHQKHMMRYLRYVFNDHFALICTFLVGGLGLYYSELLKTLPQPFRLGGWIVLLLWVSVLPIGRLATLTKPADLIFLLAKESQMTAYLKRALRYSLWLPFGVLFLVVGASMPLIVVSVAVPFSYFPLYVLMMWLLKTSDLYLQRLHLYQDTSSRCKRQRIIWVLVVVASISSSLWFSPWIGLLLAVGQVLWFGLVLKVPQQLLSWDEMIQEEQTRLHRIYRFINLFTDVPQITAQAKRRKYLDWALHWVPKVHKNTYLYLYLRRLVRGGQYGGLYVRLTVIAAGILCFVQEAWISLAVGCLFIYLIGFQLLPLANEFQYMVLTHLYPIQAEQKNEAMKKVLALLLFFAALIFAVIECFTLTTMSQWALTAGGYFIFTGGFLKLYMPNRLKKMNA